MSVESDLERSHRQAAHWNRKATGLAALQAVYNAVRGQVPAQWGLPGGRLFGKPLTASQWQMVAEYVRTGYLSAAGHRAMGKSFALAAIAALELEAGNSVLYRTGLDYYGERFGHKSFLENLAHFLGAGKVKAARESSRLWLPASKLDYHGTAGRGAAADLRDEPWLGGYFHRIRSDRVAQVGSLPERTMRLDDRRDNPFLPNGFWEAYDRQTAATDAPEAAPPTPPAAQPLREEDGADVCIRVGPHGVEG